MEKKGIPVEEYRAQIQLDAPVNLIFFNKSQTGKHIQAIEGILSYLQKEERRGRIPLSTWDKGSIKTKRDLIYRFLISRPPTPIPDEKMHMINALLQHELQERKVTAADSIPNIVTQFKVAQDSKFHSESSKMKLWQGDITAIAADCIVNAANSQLLGCFLPHHMCIDNIIHARAGPQLREDCNIIMKIQKYPEPTGIAKITRGYNLPSKFVIHTVGPIWEDNARESRKDLFKKQLTMCYRNTLDLTLQAPEIHSIAFCAISTGVFGFPSTLAAEIAINTVSDWLHTHPSVNLSVIFDVYSDQDYKIYYETIEHFIR